MIASERFSMLPEDVPVFLRRTLQDNVYEFLRSSLMEGRFQPGERLTVRGLAHLTSTSPMPIREAMKRLASEGGLEPLSTGAIRVPVLSAEELQEIAAIRVEVEGLATEWAARHMTADRVQELKGLNKRIQKAIRKGDVGERAKLNEQFHFGIYRTSGSNQLVRIIENLWLRIGPTISRLMYLSHSSGGGIYENQIDWHEPLLDALAAKNPQKARHALVNDVSEAAAYIIELARADQLLSGGRSRPPRTEPSDPGRRPAGARAAKAERSRRSPA